MALRASRRCLAALLMLNLAGTPLLAQALVGDGTITCGEPYVVQSGDTLSLLAKRAYGTTELYSSILDSNNDLLGGDPNRIAVGMSIAIPCLDASGETSTADIETAIAAEGPLSPEDLDALFGPVALFPDTVLTPLLVAVTYPLDVVKAGRFVAESTDLPDTERATAASKQDWDPTVRQLAAGYPDLVTRMSDHIDWTEQAGEAVLAQTDDVLASVQRLRAKAMENGYLTDNEAQTIEVTNNTISIAPATPGVVYVPTYESEVVYTTPISSSPQYVYGYDDDDDDWEDALLTGAIILGGAIILDEIFDDDDWNGVGGWGDDDVSIDWDGGDINIDRGDINVGGGDRVTIGGGDRTEIGGGNRVTPYGEGNRANQVGDANRDAARQKIETRQSSGRETAKLPATRPADNRKAASRPEASRSNAAARPAAGNRATQAARPTQARAPSASRSQATRSPSRSNNAMSGQSRQRASASSSRGRQSAGRR